MNGGTWMRRGVMRPLRPVKRAWVAIGVSSPDCSSDLDVVVVSISGSDVPSEPVTVPVGADDVVVDGAGRAPAAVSSPPPPPPHPATSTTAASTLRRLNRMRLSRLQDD